MDQVTVIGGGVVGLTTAYYLAVAGRQVRVIEGAPALARGASGGNAGLIAPGHAYAWGTPNIARVLLSSALERDKSVRVSLNRNPGLIGWSTRFLRECTPARFEHNTKGRLRWAQEGQRRLDELVEAEGFDGVLGRQGLLYLLPDDRSVDHADAARSVLGEQGAQQQILTADQARAIEPALESLGSRFVGAVYDPRDSSADCNLFCSLLTQRLEELGVAFDIGTPVASLDADGTQVTGLTLDDGRRSEVGQVVLASGMGSKYLAAGLGLHLPLQAIKGYAIDVQVPDDVGPTIGGIHEGARVAWSRTTQTLRIAGLAEISSPASPPKQADIRTVMKVASWLLPERFRTINRFHVSMGFRPATPDSLPIVGRSRSLSNLYFNTGHGSLGWTMACGTGDHLARQIMDDGH